MKKIPVSIVLAILVALGFVLGASGSKPPNHKVTLCHATHSATNPYVTITVDVASAGVAADLHGHRGHSEDIIPTFTYDGKTYAGQGDQSILANGCKVGGTTSTNTSTSTSTSTTTNQTTTSSTELTTTTSSTSTTSDTSTNTEKPSSTNTTPTTTTANSTTGTITPASKVKPPTKAQLQRELKKQERLPGTGRTDNGGSPNQLPHTGFNLSFGLFGFLLVLGGILLRRFARQP